MRRLVAVAAAALVLPGAASAVVPAAAPAPAHPPRDHGARFTIAPVGAFPKGYFVLDALPGSRIREVLAVTNAGDAAGTVHLAAVDATTGQTSGAVYLDSAAARTGIGRWVVLGRRSLTLAPHETARVPVVVSVPQDAAAGQYVGGLVAEGGASKPPPVRQGKRGALAIRIRQLSIVAVQVNLPGPRIVGVRATSTSSGRSNGYQWIYVGLRNDGNVMVKPTGRLVVRDAAGLVVVDERFELDTFLPRTAIDYPLVVRRRELADGAYRATVELRPTRRARPLRTRLPLEVKETPTTQVYTSPKPAAPAPAAPHEAAPFALPGGASLPLLAAGGVLLLALLAALAWSLRARRRRPPHRPVAPVAFAAAPPVEPPAAAPHPGSPSHRQPPRAPWLRPAGDAAASATAGPAPAPLPVRPAAQAPARPAAAPGAPPAPLAPSLPRRQSPMTFATDPLRRPQLRRSFRGYAADPVERLLADAAAALEATGRERDDLDDRVRQVEQLVEHYRQREERVGDALIVAEQNANELRTRARREAELVLEEARQHARELVHDASLQRERILADARSVRAFLESALGALDERRLRAAEPPAFPPDSGTAGDSCADAA